MIETSSRNDKTVSLSNRQLWRQKRQQQQQQHQQKACHPCACKSLVALDSGRSIYFALRQQQHQQQQQMATDDSNSFVQMALVTICTAAQAATPFFIAAVVP